MQVREIMSRDVVKINPEESVEVAARALTHYNIGFLPVCSDSGKLCGLVTDRDLVTRCIAGNLSPAQTKVREVMTGRILSVTPDMDVSVAAHLMGRQQVRRLPVVENDKLCGVVSLGDLAASEENTMDAADALWDITENLRK